MAFVRMPNYANKPSAYVRGFKIIQRDIRDLYEYVEPSEKNLKVFSERIGKLLTSACFEVESSFKAILTENGYSSSKNLTMNDYAKIEKSHRLSEYEVMLPEWSFNGKTFAPFRPWKNGEKLRWY